MSFEHKYLKYKQKYLELKKQLESMQQVGGALINTDTILELDRLSDTPTSETKLSYANQLAGYLYNGNEEGENSESDIENLNALTETPKENTMVVNIDSSSEEVNSEEEKSEKTDDSEDDSSSPSEQSESEQEGGNLDTSISELEEIFSQLGGKNKKDDDSSENSSLSSLSSLEDSSSDFDF